MLSERENLQGKPQRNINPIREFQLLLEQRLQLPAGIDPKHLVLREAPNHTDADFGVSVSRVAKALRQDAPDVAKIIADQIERTDHPWIQKTSQEGAYANIELNVNLFGREVVHGVLSEGSEYGKENLGHGSRVVIDMSSPNIAKRMNYPHLRSTIIGDALARIYRATGHEVIRDNHIGDWGTQFGKLTEAIKLWGDEEEIMNSDDPVEALQDLYVKFHEEAEKQLKRSRQEIDRELEAGKHIEGFKEALEDGIKTVMDRKKINRDEVDVEKVRLDTIDKFATSELENKGREWFRKLENGDPEARRIWELCVDVSLKEFEKIYSILGIEFEKVLGESFYESMLQGVIEEVRNSKIGTISSGALVVDMEDTNLGTAIVQKSDGASLYMTRDLATAEYRESELNADTQIYVVGDAQKFYFRQLFEILKRLDHPIGEQSKHVYFGLVSVSAKTLFDMGFTAEQLEIEDEIAKTANNAGLSVEDYIKSNNPSLNRISVDMSTRKGIVILLKDVISEGLKRADAVLSDRQVFKNDSELRADTAKKVAVAALKWSDLHQGVSRPIVFDWDEVLNFEGESGPYVQYTAVRANTILEKAGLNLETAKEIKINENEEVYQTKVEKELIIALSMYSSALVDAKEGNSPNRIAEYVFKVASLYGQFYHDVSVLSAETSIQRDARLKLSAATVQVITNALDLLGIEVPQRM